MVVAGSWSLGLVSTAEIVHFFYGINLFIGPNMQAGLKFSHPVRTGRLNFRLFHI
jgi:hypothetical protein